MPDLALGIDEVERRPILVVEGAPDRMLVIHRDGIVDAELLRGPSHVVQVLLESELRGVHPDHHQSSIPVLIGPCPDIGL